MGKLRRMVKILYSLLVLLVSVMSFATNQTFTSAGGGLKPVTSGNGDSYTPIMALCSGSNTVQVNLVDISADMLPGFSAGDAQVEIFTNTSMLASDSAVHTRISNNIIGGVSPTAVTYTWASNYPVLSSLLFSGFVKDHVLPFDGNLRTIYKASSTTYPATTYPTPITLPAGGACIFLTLTGAPPASEINYVDWDLEFTEIVQDTTTL